MTTRIISQKSQKETTINKCRFYFSCYTSVQNTKVQYIAKAVVFTRREATQTVLYRFYKYVAISVTLHATQIVSS